MKSESFANFAMHAAAEQQVIERQAWAKVLGDKPRYAQRKADKNTTVWHWIAGNATLWFVVLPVMARFN